MSRHAEELAAMRAAWAQRPRQGPPEWYPFVPDWAANDPGLRGGFRNQLWSAGVIDWGWIVIATDSLWRAGNDVGQGNILFTDDVYLREDPGRLDAVSTAIWEERTNPKQAVGRRAFREWAATPYLPTVTERVPQPFSEGRVVWVAGTLITRALPAGRLMGHLVPIVRMAGNTLGGIAIAPRFAWAADLVARWEERPGPT